MEALAQSVLAEALRNAHKHARPSSVRVHVGRVDGTFVLEVRNDGAQPGSRGAPAWACDWPRSRRFSAARSWSSDPRDSDWRVRLVVPVEEDSPE